MFPHLVVVQGVFPQVEAVEHLHGAFAPQAQLHTEVGREGGIVQQIGFDGRVLCVEVEAENAGQHQCPQALQYALFEVHTCYPLVVFCVRLFCVRVILIKRNAKLLTCHVL